MTTLPTRVEGFLKQNEKFAKDYKGVPTMVQLRANRASGEATMILTCLDPRCVPEQYFPGAQLAVIRNAGGRASKDVVKSVVGIRTLANPGVLMVVHHTDCGMTHMTQDQIVSEAKERTPDAAADIDALGDFGCFAAADFEETVRQDVRTLRAEKALAGMQILGFTMDVKDGVVKHLEV